MAHIEPGFSGGNMDIFEAYGILANKLSTPALISGRNLFNVNVEDIVADVARKLEITPESTLLEVGCGVGFLLTPLARMVERAVGVDSDQCIEKYREFGTPENVELIAGRWPYVAISECFDSILVFSVMGCLPDRDEAMRFIEKCLSLLKHNGKLLIAEIQNIDMIHRFKLSDLGKKVTQEYMELKLLHENHETREQASVFSQARQSDGQDAGNYFNDDFALDLLKDLRKRGYDAFILPQSSLLPFSLSREDILIWKR
jgi:2-polyprenyl-3-methyl-5-hydroxy-6-metoxy-1,4-benzoquinol methylase